MSSIESDEIMINNDVNDSMDPVINNSTETTDTLLVEKEIINEEHIEKSQNPPENIETNQEKWEIHFEQQEIQEKSLQYEDLKNQLLDNEITIDNLRKDLKYSLNDASLAKAQLRDANKHIEEIESQFILLRKKIKKSADGETGTEKIPEVQLSDDFQYNVDLDNCDKISLEINAYSTHLLLSKNNDELHDKIKELEKYILDIDQEKKNLRKNLDQTEQELENLRRKTFDIELEKSDLTSQINRLSNLLQDEKTYRQQLDVTCHGYQQHYTLISEKYSSVQLEILERDAVQRENDTITNKLREAEETIRANRLQIQQLQSELADTKSLAQHSKQLMSDRFERQIESLNSEKENSNNTINQLHLEIDKLKLSIKESFDRNEKKEANDKFDSKTLRSTERKLNSALKNIDDLNSENLNLKLDIKQLQETIKQEKLKNSQLSLENVDIQSKVRFLEKELSRANQVQQTVSLPPILPYIVTDQTDSEPDG